MGWFGRKKDAPPPSQDGVQKEMKHIISRTFPLRESDAQYVEIIRFLLQFVKTPNVVRYTDRFLDTAQESISREFRAWQHRQRSGQPHEELDRKEIARLVDSRLSNLAQKISSHKEKIAQAIRSFIAEPRIAAALSGLERKLDDLSSAVANQRRFVDDTIAEALRRKGVHYRGTLAPGLFNWTEEIPHILDAARDGIRGEADAVERSAKACIAELNSWRMRSR